MIEGKRIAASSAGSARERRVWRERARSIGKAKKAGSITATLNEGGGLHAAWRISVPRICPQMQKSHRKRRAKTMAIDEVVLTLKRDTRTSRTKIRMSGTLLLKTDSIESRGLLLMLSRLHEPMCIALPADAPWSWLEIWAEDIDAAEDHLSIRFLLPRRDAVNR